MPNLTAYLKHLLLDFHTNFRLPHMPTYVYTIYITHNY